ncbi:MAG: alpha/beta hydrolase [Phormidesmis sp.]
MIVAMKFPYKYLSRAFSGLQCRQLRCRQRWQALSLLSLAIACSPQLAKPTYAAERVTFSFGAIERSVSVESLEIYVEEGRVTKELEPYLAYIQNIDPQATEQVRDLLTRRADLDVTTVAQFAYTPQGEYLLDQAGDVFRTGARLPGGQGLRGAAIVSAADSTQGLTLLNVIRRFPTPVLRVNLRRGLAIASQASQTVDQTRKAIDLINQLSFRSAALPLPEGVSAAMLNDLVSRPGPYRYRKTSVRIKASDIPVDIYQPRASGLDELDLPAEEDRAIPAVIISHGLGSDRESYAYLARFLAEHGFAVIAVEHSGSSADQLNALVSGRTDQVVPDEEFISRPMLISAVLDDLQARARINKNFSGIDFDNVGIIGQSFGGYTALAVAGAPVNLESLRQACPSEFSVNLSLLLQCQALAIGSPEQPSISFADPRIRAVVAINPITSAIFGPDSLSQVDVPVLMMAGSADTVAPALPEQIRPFTWLSGNESESSVNQLQSDRYLLVMEGATHFSTIGISGRETFGLPPEIIGPSPEIAQRYTQVMSLAFLSRYLKDDSRYQPVLTSAFTARFSSPEMPLSIVPRLEPSELDEQLRSVVDDVYFAARSQQTLDSFAELETLAEKEAAENQTN